MARRRLGVALVLDDPIATEIDGLRRGLGDRSLARILPHVTLVPPVNVRAGDLPETLDLVRRAAARCGSPLTLTLGPPASFLPANPVVILPVGGDLPELRRLRDGVFAGPLERSLSWPWVPHVTLADEADPDVIPSALAALRGYRAVTSVDRVVVLEERRVALDGPDPGAGRPGATTRRWEPLADAALAPAVVVGRGGLDLAVVEGRVLDPDAADLIDAVSGADGPVPPDVGRRIVVTGLVDGSVAGAGVAWLADDGGHVLVAVVPDRRSGGLGRQLLARTELAVRRAGWDCPTLRASGPAGFYEACSRWSTP